MRLIVIYCAGTTANDSTRTASDVLLHLLRCNMNEPFLPVLLRAARSKVFTPTMNADAQKHLCQRLSKAAYELTLESLRAKVTEEGADLLQTWAARNGTPGYWAFTARIQETTGGSRPNPLMVLVFRGTLCEDATEWLEYVRRERYRPLFDATGAEEVYDLWIEILEQVRRPHATVLNVSVLS